MSTDILNPGNIRVWGYDGPIEKNEPDILMPQLWVGKRITSSEFRKFWFTNPANILKFRSIIRKAKQATTI